MFGTEKALFEGARRYGLATCCAAGPVLLAFLAFNLVVSTLMPASVPHLQFNYEAAKPKAAMAAPPGRAEAAPAPTDAARPGARRSEQVLPDPDILPLSLQVAGRYAYAIASGFLYLVSAGALIFGFAVAVQRLTRRELIALAVPMISIAVFIAHSFTPYDFARPLVIDNLLNAADHFPAVAQLQARNTGAVVRSLVSINTEVGLVSVAMVLVALFALSIRPRDSELDAIELKRRLTAIRCALGFASAILVAAVLSNKTLNEWPLKLILESQAMALRPMADALTLEVGAAGTIALFAAFAPAVAAWTLDVACYRARSARPVAAAKTEPADLAAAQTRIDDGLVFAPISSVMSIIAVLAPVLASPLVDSVRSILAAIPVN